MQARRTLRQFFTAALLALALPAFAQTLGKDYTLIEPAQPTESGSKIEVLEFFSYGCPHCAEFHEPLSAWIGKLPADVQFRRLPITFGRGAWLNLAKLYFALEASGELAKLDGAVFKAIHTERNTALFDDKTVGEWVSKVGGNGQKVSENMNAFSVVSKAKRGDAVAGAYRLQGVPALVINGKYLISGKEHAEMLAIADKLIAKARAESGKK